MSFPANLPEVIRRGQDAGLLDLFTCALGRVHTYNSATSKADIELGTHRPLANKNGSLVSEVLSICPDVPVLWFNAGGHAITCNLNKGDTVLILFTQFDPSNFLSTGIPGDPAQSRTHSQGYGVCVPLGRPDTNPLDSTVINEAMAITSKTLRLGSHVETEVFKAAVGPIVKDALEEIIDWLKNHTHPVSGAATTAPNLALQLDAIDTDLESSSVYVEGP